MACRNSHFIRKKEKKYSYNVLKQTNKLGIKSRNDLKGKILKSLTSLRTIERNGSGSSKNGGTKAQPDKLEETDRNTAGREKG